MEIKNLSQLKKAIANRIPFTILEHNIHPGYTGQTRIANLVQTNGFYSIVKDDPESNVTKANYGKGCWLPYGKASDWSFEDGVCTLYTQRKGVKEPVWTIKF